MTGPATPLDGALVAFLVQVLDRFEATVSDPDALLATLQSVGLDEATVTEYRAFLDGRATDIAKLSTDLPALLTVLESSSPNLPSLIAPVRDLWSVVSGLVADAPKATPAQLPHAPSLPNGDVLGQFVTTAVDGVLRREGQALWAALSATGLVGPGRSILSSLESAAAAPLPYVWDLYQSLRRENTLSIAGVLTGPRVTSMSSVELGPKEAPSPEAAATFGADAVVLQRLILGVAADTYDELFTIKVEILGTAADPPQFLAGVLSTGAIAAPVNLGPALQLSLDPLNAPFALAMTDFGHVTQIAGSPPKLSLSAKTERAYASGPDGGIRLSLQQPIFVVEATPDSWDAQFGVTAFELTVPRSAPGDLLGLLLPSSGVALRGKLLFRLDAAGFHFDGGVGLSAKWPDTIRLPGVVVHSLQTTVAASGSNFPITATATLVVSLGPLTATIEGFGVEQPLRLTTDGSGDLGIIDLDRPAFSAPRGIGIAIDASLVKGGGFLRLTDTEIAGALELSVVLGSLELAVQAFGVIQEVNGQVSFLVVMSVTFSPPLEIFLGLTLNAVGGIFGFNRTVDTTALRGLIRDGHAQDVLIPADLIGRADTVLSAVGTVFPPASHRYIAGPILELGWGRPTSLVTMTAGVVLTFPDPDVVVIIGEVRIALPEPKAPIIDLRADFAGTINATTGDVAFDASLARSRIATFDVTGDLLLRGGSESFVFTAGGFHPQFTPPPDLPTLRRLSISISPSSLLHIAAEAYFAVTGSSIQFGAAMSVEATLGPLGAKGHVSLDTLIHTEPTLHFSATVSGDFHLTVGGDDLATMNVDVLLEGPGHWHARATASISFLFFSVSGTLDLDWGTDASVVLGPPVDVAARVHDALADDSTWRHVVPAADAGLAQLRKGADGLHPLGRLRLTQTAAPLDVALEKFGGSAVTSPEPVTVAVTASGGVVTVAQEQFAAGQFFQLSDEDRVGKPSFLPFDAGATVAGQTWQVSDPQTATVVYEESLGLDDGRTSFTVAEPATWGWVGLGAAGRLRPVLTEPATPRIAVSAPTYSVGDAATGAIVATGSAAAVTASTWRSADTVAVADFEGAS